MAEFITGTYEVNGLKCDLKFPFQADETFEDALARVAPIVRDALGITPAVDTNVVELEKFRAFKRRRK